MMGYIETPLLAWGIPMLACLYLEAGNSQPHERRRGVGRECQAERANQVGGDSGGKPNVRRFSQHYPITVAMVGSHPRQESSVHSCYLSTPGYCS
jgi:hypothetical protein